MRAHVFISGRVQGVFFRKYTQEQAQKLKIKGWVKNLADGRVEAVFEGERQRVEAMLNWCYQGSPLSQVKEVKVRKEPEQKIKEFEIK